MTTFDRTFTYDAVKLSTAEVEELHNINKMFNMKKWYVALAFIAIVSAVYLWMFGAGLQNVQNIGLLFMGFLTAIVCMLPLYWWRFAKFSRRIGVKQLFFLHAVLLDEEGNKLADQTR